MSNTPATKRVVNVQVPGEAPKQPETAQQPELLGAAVAVPDAPEGAAAAPLTTDFEDMRAQIRAEEQAKARAELGAQIQAAASVIDKPAESIARSQHDYRKMRAVDIDHTKLTAPVMTLDGYLCPPAPEAKK